jgi:hypothetical protein
MPEAQFPRNHLLTTLRIERFRLLSSEHHAHRLYFAAWGSVGCNPMTTSWDKSRAQHLTREAAQALRQLQSQAHEGSRGLSARLEVLIAEKRTAYEATRNVERFEAAIQAIVDQAQAVCPKAHERGRHRECKEWTV